MIEDLLSDHNANKSKSGGVLPPEDLAQILSSIQTILSLYVGGGENQEEEEGDIEISDKDELSIKRIADYLNLPLQSLGDQKSVALQNSLPNFVKIGIQLKPWKGTDEKKSIVQQSLLLHVSFAIRRNLSTSSTSNDDTLWPTWSLQKVAWLEEEKYVKLVETGKSAEEQLKSRIQQENTTSKDTPKDSQDSVGDTVSLVLMIAEAITEAALEL